MQDHQRVSVRSGLISDCRRSQYRMSPEAKRGFRMHVTHVGRARGGYCPGPDGWVCGIRGSAVGRDDDFMYSPPRADPNRHPLPALCLTFTPQQEINLRETGQIGPLTRVQRAQLRAHTCGRQSLDRGVLSQGAALAADELGGVHEHSGLVGHGAGQHLGRRHSGRIFRPGNCKIDGAGVWLLVGG
ncbi:hypothetical protein C8R44DRAFT_728341 [Mycena epipterygia]|nr:hypothetical protein C8R44DRAFT_728341 [Mycena epipterygia]